MKTNKITGLFFILIFIPLIFSCSKKNQANNGAKPQGTQQVQTKDDKPENPNREKIDEYFKGLTKIVVRAENNSNPDAVKKLQEDFNTFTDSYPNISDMKEWTDEDTEKQVELIDRFVESTIDPVIFDESDEDSDELSDDEDFDPFADLGLDDELNYGDLPPPLSPDDF